MSRALNEKRNVYLAGIGPGGAGLLTAQVQAALETCDCILGAKRVTEAVESFGKPVYSIYNAPEVAAFIKGQEDLGSIVVVLSGDPGFYSGAKKLIAALKELPNVEVTVLPGISSIICLAARLGISWEDAALVSIHGRHQNFIHAILHNEKTFLLLGGEDSGRGLCEKLSYYGLTDTEVYIGRQLSCPDEEIIHKKGGELKEEDCLGLAAAFIVNPSPESCVYRSIADTEFIRGQVPMTKSEVRTVSLSKLALTKDAVLYDVGAGTGSVSVEAALLSGDIKVYAVEKNPQAVRLLKENRRKFGCDNICIKEGTAPEALKELEAPTHVFIGGSSKELKEIVRTVRKKNPSVRIVITAVSLETVREVMEAEAQGLLKAPEIVQIAAARAKKLGGHHLMTALNPVYVISDGTESREE